MRRVILRWFHELLDHPRWWELLATVRGMPGVKCRVRSRLSSGCIVIAVMLAICCCSNNSTATQATTSSVAGAGTSVATSPPDPGCPLTVDAVTAAIGTVFPGPVRLDTEPGAVDCQYQVDQNRWLHIRVTPYADNRMASITVNTTTVEYGGSSPQQVFTSTATAYRAIADASGGERKFEQHPDVGAGLVTNGVGGFVLAGTRGVWYSGDFGIFTSPDYNVVAMNVAKALAAG